MNKDDFSEEITRRFKNMTPEERARIMIDTYFKLPSPDDRMAAAFFDWLSSPSDAEAKEAAMQRKFDEILGAPDPYGEDEPQCTYHITHRK